MNNVMIKNIIQMAVFNRRVLVLTHFSLAGVREPYLLI